ncbi:MAG: hypothetical protein ACE5HV_10245 [Acidobacteriota bacterium]
MSELDKMLRMDRGAASWHPSPLYVSIAALALMLCTIASAATPAVPSRPAPVTAPPPSGVAEPMAPTTPSEPALPAGVQESTLPAATPVTPAQLPERSQRLANYRIEVRLDAQAKRLVGSETLSWRNSSPDPIQELWFHSYWNAAKNNQSSFMREAGEFRGNLQIEEWGWIEVGGIRLEDGTDLTPTLEYMQPDDGNEQDQTVFRVRLPKPVAPGTEVVVELDWTSRIPKGFARAGYYGDFYFIAQWFPKIGVYENGAWNCHQYHARSEFYADYGVYEVAITVPDGYTVGATGRRVGEVENGDGTSTLTYFQQDVHDFAWLADRDIEVVEDRFEEPGLQAVDITLLLQPEHERYRDRYLNATKHALHYFGSWYGTYPYEVLTVVDPQPGSTAGGMEYPTLFTGGAGYHNPDWLLSPEGVTVHEFGHQFWYGLVGNNEFEAAWLDEGFNTYSETKVLDLAYGPSLPAYNVAGLWFQRFVPVNLGSLPLIPFPGWHSSSAAVAAFRDLAWITFPSGVGQEAADQHRRRYLQAPDLDPMERKAWEFFNGASYGVNSYPKPGAFLETLESYFGEELWREVMRTYHQRWRFRHPGGRDFLAVVNEVTGEDMTEFFEQVVWGSGILDYGVEPIISYPKPQPRGAFGADGETIIDPDAGQESAAPAGEPEPETEPLIVSEVAVRRHGEVVFPIELVVTFADGSTRTEHWDGRYRWHRYRYERPVGVTHAEIYPGRPLWLDANLTNNGAVAAPTDAPARRLTLTFLFWVQNLLHWFSLIA